MTRGLVSSRMSDAPTCVPGNLRLGGEIRTGEELYLERCRRRQLDGSFPWLELGGQTHSAQAPIFMVSLYSMLSWAPWISAAFSLT